MDPSLDEFSTTQNKISSIFKENWDFSSNVVKTRSLIDLNRDLLFVWNNEDCNIFVVNATVLTGKEDVKCYQRLELTAPPDFLVEKLRVNDTGTHVALVGPRGACIVQLPGRWGSSGLFADGRPSVLCKSCSVEASLFLRSPSLEILELRWCPPPLQDQIFVVLVSNNTLRLYRAADPSTALQEWRVGRPLGRGQLMDPAPAGDRRLLPLLAALGHTAVAFDFLPPVSRSSLRVRSNTDAATGDVSLFQPGDRAWGSSTPLPPRRAEDSALGGDTDQAPDDDVQAIAVLFGQGDVYILVPPNFSPFTPSTERAALYGPLVMRPTSDDNLGADSCSLTCLQVQPPVLVIATATGGKLYHGLLLTQPKDAVFNISGVESDVDSVVGAEECGKYLRIIEQVNLNIGMGVGEATSEDPSAFTCPMYLTSDPTSPSRYFCTHDAGIHCVTLPLVQELQKFNAKQCTIQEAMKALPRNGVPSRIHYLLCTQLGNTQSPQPLQGFTSLPLTSAALALLPHPVLVPLPTLAVPPLPKSVFSDSLHILEGKEMTKKMDHEPNFEEKIRCILQHSSTQPLLRLPPGTKLSNRDFLDLLNKSVAILRIEYLAKLNVAMEEIKHKSSLLEKTQAVRLRQISELRTIIVDGLEHQKLVRDKMRDAMELAKDNLRRLTEVARKERMSQPEMSEAELQLSKTLESHQAKIEKYKQAIEAINTRMINFQKKRDEQIQTGAMDCAYISESEAKEYVISCEDMGRRIHTLTTNLNNLRAHLQRIRMHSTRVGGNETISVSSP